MDLVAACTDVIARIEDIVIVTSPVAGGAARHQGEERGTVVGSGAGPDRDVRNLQAAYFTQSEHAPSVAAHSLTDANRETILKMFEREESKWVGRVTRAAAAELYDSVETAANALCEAIEADFGPLLAAPAQREGVRKLLRRGVGLAAAGGKTSATTAVSRVKTKPDLVLDYRDVALCTVFVLCHQVVVEIRFSPSHTAPFLKPTCV
jgi:hypothetical protein